MGENEIINNQLEQEDGLGDESPRKLATISTIKSIKPIPGADKILVAEFTTNGWKVVVGVNDNLKVGDKVVFFEIDSWLPKEDRYSYTPDGQPLLEGRCNKVFNGKEGYRIKSIKLRGQISQGFALPISVFSPQYFYEGNLGLKDGDDVTRDLGVKLWQAPTNGGYGFCMGRSAGSFPTHIVKKTDQERIQSMPNGKILDTLGYDWEVTEKVDGTSATYICWQDPANTPYGETDKPLRHVFKACSRNLIVKPPTEETITFKRPIRKDEIDKYADETGAYPEMVTDTKKEVVNSVYWDMVKKYAIEERLTTYCINNNCNLALQGEIVGSGIQKNPLGLKETEFMVFDVWNIDTQRYLSAPDRLAVILALNEIRPETNKPVPFIQSVPIVYHKYKITPNLFQIQDSADRVRTDFAEIPPGKRQNEWFLFMDYLIEGIIDKLLALADEPGKYQRKEGIVLKSLQNPMVSFKVISNKYLLKQSD